MRTYHRDKQHFVYTRVFLVIFFLKIKNKNLTIKMENHHAGREVEFHAFIVKCGTL